MLPRVREKRPPLVIFDLNSSRLRPLDAIAAMKADPELQECGRSATSRTSDRHDRRRAASGIDEVLARSAFTDQLGEILT